MSHLARSCRRRQALGLHFTADPHPREQSREAYSRTRRASGCGGGRGGDDISLKNVPVERGGGGATVSLAVRRRGRSAAEAAERKRQQIPERRARLSPERSSSSDHKVAVLYSLLLAVFLPSCLSTFDVFTQCHLLVVHVQGCYDNNIK